MRPGVAWVPALLLLVGFWGRFAMEPDRTLELDQPLTEFPDRLAGWEGAPLDSLTTGELAVLRPDRYLLRNYALDSERAATLFIAFYGKQTGGSSIHSPRNCLPGSGWGPVLHDRIATPTTYGLSEINRYLVEHESGARALVYYWYQGRGRIASNEYSVKFELMRDAIFRRRTDEALVRLVIPVGRGRGDLLSADARASILVREVIRAVADHVPA